MSVETDKQIEVVLEGQSLTAAQYAAWLEDFGDYTLGDKLSKWQKNAQENEEIWLKESKNPYAWLTNKFNELIGLSKIQEKLKITPQNERLWSKGIDAALKFILPPYNRVYNTANDIVNLWRYGRARTRAGDLYYLVPASERAYKKGKFYFRRIKWFAQNQYRRTYRWRNRCSIIFNIVFI